VQIQCPKIIIPIVGKETELMEISLGNFQINSLNKFTEENPYDEYKMEISDMKL
jgi:hypothetical protein